MASAAAAAARPRRTVPDRSSAPTRAAASAAPAPSVAPPTSAPTTKHVAVLRKRRPRLASARGVIVDNIDNPHGDQVERAAAASAVTAASTAIPALTL